MSIEFRNASPEVVAFFDGVEVEHTNQVILCTVALDVDRIEDADGREFVPVVRCKDCKHIEGDVIHFQRWCEYLAMNVIADDFCCWGERRDA